MSSTNVGMSTSATDGGARAPNSLKAGTGGEATPLMRNIPLGETKKEDVPSEWRPKPIKQHIKVGEWRSTAICGNDLLSSCLYCCAICLGDAGWMAPIGLLCVGVALKLYQGVYGENGMALPFNGGVYTASINSLTKPKACVCACFSIMSYIATALVSAASATKYVFGYFEEVDHWLYMGITISIMFVVGLLYIWGIAESATVALIIFISHCTMLVTLICSGAYITLVVDGGTRLAAAFDQPLPHWWPLCVVYGFASGMLGITGYETSCNYIEEQAEGVYPKTLRNMWWVVTTFNPLITLFVLGVCDTKEIAKDTDDLLNAMGANTLGKLLDEAFDVGVFKDVMIGWVTFDAFIVLFGAVLTAFVGAAGLIRRLALDGCLPEFFLHTNECRGTPHWIPISFGTVCTAIFLIFDGVMEEMAGMYTIAFMLVMTSMAGCHIILKKNVPHMKRTIQVGIWRSVMAAFTTLLALGVCIYLHNMAFVVFLVFFVITLTLCLCSVRRIRMFKCLASCGIFPQWCKEKAIECGQSHRMAYFAHGGEKEPELTRIIEVFDLNELSRHITFVHFSPEACDECVSAENLKAAVEVVRCSWPDFRSM